MRTEETPAFWDVVRAHMDEHGIEDVEELHRRFVATDYADLPTPGRKRGTRLSLDEFRKQLAGDPTHYCGEVPRGLAQVFGFVGQRQEAELALSYVFGRPRMGVHPTKPLQ